MNVIMYDSTEFTYYELRTLFRGTRTSRGVRTGDADVSVESRNEFQKDTWTPYRNHRQHKGVGGICVAKSSKVLIAVRWPLGTIFMKTARAFKASASGALVQDTASDTVIIVPPASPGYRWRRWEDRKQDSRPY